MRGTILFALALAAAALSPIGAAAQDAPARAVFDRVAAERVDADRVRIRLAGTDMLVDDSVAASLTAENFRRRLQAERSHGGIALFAWSVFGLAVLLLVRRGVAYAVARSNREA